MNEDLPRQALEKITELARRGCRACGGKGFIRVNARRSQPCFNCVQAESNAQAIYALGLAAGVPPKPERPKVTVTVKGEKQQLGDLFDGWAARLYGANGEAEVDAIADEIDSVGGTLWLQEQLYNAGDVAALRNKVERLEAQLAAGVPPPQKKLQQLVETWRAYAQALEEDCRATLVRDGIDRHPICEGKVTIARHCANELEELLRLNGADEPTSEGPHSRSAQ